MPDTEPTIPPALTPEEWARPHHFIQCYDSWGDGVDRRTGVGEINAGPKYLTLTSHQHSEIADFNAPTDRHALAALALYQQPFGFTHDLLESLRIVEWEYSNYSPAPDKAKHAAALRTAAAIVASLLPPRP